MNIDEKTYNDFYKKHGADVQSDPSRFREIAKLCKNNVLDIACGTGDLADFFDGEYTGIDFSEIAVRMAKETRRKTANFLKLDAARNINEPLQNFDTIVIGEFLEHIEDDRQLFQNIKKWATPNARIIITVPNGNRVPDKKHVREFTVPELRARFSKLGQVKFYNWSGFYHRILMTVDLNKKNEDLLAMVIIAKNEEMGLERCILSAIDFTDNIVIAVDRSSFDKTAEIAKRYADTFKEFDWKDDFSWARNFAQEGVTAKYIFSIDGHEYVESAPKIRERLLEDVDGFFIRIRWDGGDAFSTIKIFKSTIKWNHAIHNAVKCNTTAKYMDFVIVHDRKTGQSSEAWKIRQEQVRVMMEKELLKEARTEKNPARAYFYLARYYRAFKRWPEAIKYYKKYLKYKRNPGESWLCCYEAGNLMTLMGKPTKALKFFNKAEKIIPNRWETAKQISIAYMSFERWNKALFFLTDSLKVNTGEFTFLPEKRDDADTWDRIGFCFYQIRQYKKAKIAWERSIEIDHDSVRIKLNKKRVEFIKEGIII